MKKEKPAATTAAVTTTVDNTAVKTTSATSSLTTLADGKSNLTAYTDLGTIANKRSINERIQRAICDKLSSFDSKVKKIIKMEWL